jgi:hypothetical protein
MHQVSFNFYNQIRRGTASMPRPKSELTKSGKTIGVRLTEWEYQEWVKLGKSKWLRTLLKQSRAKVNELRNA